MIEHDFTDAHRKWHSCDPFELFDAPIEARVKQVSITGTVLNLLGLSNAQRFLIF